MSPCENCDESKELKKSVTHFINHRMKDNMKEY